MIKTVNRGMLLRRARAGRLRARCDMHLTDDYLFDQGNDFGKMDNFLPVHIKGPDEEHKDGHVNLTDWHFRTKSGMAYKDDKGEITLIVHGNLSYTLKVTG